MKGGIYMINPNKQCRKCKYRVVYYNSDFYFLVPRDYCIKCGDKFCINDCWHETGICKEFEELKFD